MQFMEVAERYFQVLRSVDLSGLVGTKTGDEGASKSGNQKKDTTPSCAHGRAKLAVVKKEGKNQVRKFLLISA